MKEGLRIEVGGRNLQRYEELINLVAAGRLDFDGFVDQYTPTFLLNADEWMLLDRTRTAQLAAQQDEFALTAERFVPMPGADRTSVMLQGILSRDFETTEFTKRYEEARARSPLAKKTK
ncbi:hypothetical protein [Ereboglobus luteus]|uniref:Uncharacterized protein n=1 Tax=Ereboglobus luteus TaxID=1796921 RepID=A0A2U8DZX5_9BACT|nr:hypothetical protein [Ereboglobus luteus]AWI08153.1 hypothetical protein CKA38_01740 [Ereboglobus luteus]